MTNEETVIFNLHIFCG